MDTLRKEQDCRYTRRVAVLGLRDRVRSSDICEELGVEPAEVVEASG